VIRDRPRDHQDEIAQGTDGRASNDLSWLIAGAVVLSALAMKFHAIDAVTDWSQAFDTFNLNGVMAMLLLAPICASIFSYRRYQDAKRVRAELIRMSLHDGLTGLPNRRFLHDWLQHDLENSDRDSLLLAVLFIDLDRFKIVNDTYGHELGDALMVEVANRIRQALPADARIIRYGGDEFVAICPALPNRGAGERYAGKLIEAIETPFTIGTDTMRISTSIGVAVTESRGSHQPDELMREADTAMYQAKSDGRGNYVVFDRSMQGRLTPTSVEERLRQALEHGEFRLVYQPIVRLTTGQVVGVEALIRWLDPERGLVTPDEFVPVLEETGLIVPVGAWVLQEACREARRWLDAFPGADPVTVTVNVSARQLAQVGFRDMVAEAIGQSGARPEQICLEINEGSLNFDVDAAWAVLRHVKVLGVRIALDGFGTGYSSLSYIRRFSLDVLTVDNTFIEGLAENAEDRAIVEHVVGMSRSLGIQTLGLGVETPEQLAELHRVGCDLGQGFLFSSAVLAEEISTFIADGIPDARPASIVRAEAAAESIAVAAAAAAVDAPSVVTPMPRRALAAVSATAGRIAARSIINHGDDVVADRGADSHEAGERHAAVLESILPTEGGPRAETVPSSGPPPTPPRPPRPTAPAPRPADASESAAAVLLPKLREFRPSSTDKPKDPHS
jgi:diguanylate cyclase (GGDEF)-like protein